MKKKLILLSFFVLQFLVYISLYTNIISSTPTIIFGSLWKNVKTRAEISENIIVKNKNKHKIKDYYVENHEFLINNNLAQYSSYKVIDKDEYGMINYSIEILVQFKKKLLKTMYPTKDFICVLKLSDKNNDLIELEAFESPKFYLNSAKKIIFKINPNEINFKKIVAVAAILKADFNKTLDLATFEMYLKSAEYSDEVNRTLPYSFIKYQKPTLIQSIEPRIPSVGFCVHYTYAVPDQIIPWFNRHFSFGVKEIMIYDGIKDGYLKKYLEEHYGDDERVTVKPYRIQYNDLCEKKIFFKGLNLKLSDKAISFLMELCNEFYDRAFEKKIHFRFYHEQLTSNDCFTIMSRKYEFIGYYDLDEFIYPMNSNYANFYKERKLFSCENKSKESICSMKPLTNYYKADILSENHLYNYLMSIISKYKKLKISQIRSIYFPHAGVLLPNEIEYDLINKIGSIISKINESNFYDQFPFTYNLDLHTFLIKRDDIEYIKYLYSSYQSLIPCARELYLDKIDNNISRNLVRYFYYATETRERAGKTIHYYKNVKSVFMHYARDFDKSSKMIIASAASGNTLRHYRGTPKAMKRNINGTIRKINIDYEYVFYLLNNFTDFCGTA